jgi:hypothetical protein
MKFQEGATTQAGLAGVHLLYEAGLAYLRTAIRAALAEVDTELAAAGILHPVWPRRLPPPEMVSVSVMPAHAPVITVEFTAEEIEACSHGVDHTGACRKIRSLAAAYQRVRSEPGSYPGRRRIAPEHPSP